MKKKIVFGLAGAALALEGLRRFDNFAWGVVCSRDSKIPGMIYRSAYKQNISERKEDSRVAWTREQNYEEFYMDNLRGQKLYARYLPAEKPSKTFVLCAHGYRSAGINDFLSQSKFLHEKGFNLFFIDQQACGQSEGKYISFGYYESQDLLMWADFLVKQFGDDIKIIVYGVSLGAATAIMACGSGRINKNCVGLISDCGFTSLPALGDYLFKTYRIEPRRFVLQRLDRINRHRNGYEIKEACPIEYVGNIKIPTLFVHGANDRFVPTYMVGELYDKCNAPKMLLIAEGAEHANSHRKDSVHYETALNDFFDLALGEK